MTQALLPRASEMPPPSGGSARASERPSGAARPPRAQTSAPPRRTTEIFGITLTPPELERSAILFGLLFLAALLLVVGRTARDALFLTRFPVTWIGPMWLVYGITSSVAALAYAAWAERLPRAKFTVVFTLLAAASCVALRVLIGHDLRPAYIVFYVLSEIIANFTAVLVWAIAQDLNDCQSAKRVFGLIGTGRILGTVVSGLGAGAVVTLIGTEDLIYVVVVALLAVAALTRVLAARHPLRAPPTSGEQAIEARVQRRPVWRSRYALTVALFTLLLFAILTVGDYQFKAIAMATYPERDRLASFMGFFYGGVGAFSLFVQLVIMPRLLSRHGVVGGLLAMPAAFVAATAALLASPSLAFAALLKASDNGLQFTVHDAATQLLLFPFPQALRERVRTLASAIAKPLGCSVGAVLLIVLAPPPPQPGGGADLVHEAAWLGLWSLPLGLAVIALIPRVRSGYFDAMRRTLVRRELDTTDVVYGPQTRAIFQEALAGNDSPQVLFAMDQLKRLDPELLRDALPGLTRHRSARVRATALRLLVDLAPERAAGEVAPGEVAPDEGSAGLARAALGDRSTMVRVAAIEALAALCREDAHDDLVALAESPDEETRAAAIAALVRHGGLDGMLDGAPRLRHLLESPAARDRLAAARALGMVGQPSLQRALARLLRDEHPQVRREAVRAASTVADPRLLPMLTSALNDRRLALPAARALVAIGEPAVPALAARLADPETPRAVRLGLPRVLARIGSPEALRALMGGLDEPNDTIRQKTLASASRLRLTLRAPPAPLGEVLPRIDRELDEHVRSRDEYLAVRPRVDTPLLDQHMLLRLRKGLIRALRLCELCYPRDLVALARGHVFGPDPALRANAFEVLESLLDRSLHARLVQQIERFVEIRSGGLAAAAPAAAPAGGVGGVGGGDPTAWVRREIGRDEPYSAALALDAAARRRVASVASAALAATWDPDPLVREAAAVAVAVLRPKGGGERLAALLTDPDQAVARYAHYCATTGKSGIEDEDTMYTTIEKILFLQRVPLFSRVAGDDLVALARGSLVVSLQKGDLIFRQGEPGGSLYSIISGQVVLSTDGREIARLGPRDVFGEMSIFDREPRTATAVVLEEAELLRVSAEDFHEAVHETVEIAEAVIQVLNRRLRDADRRVAETRGRLSLLASAGAGSEAALARPDASAELPPSSAERESIRAGDSAADDADVE